MKKVGSVKLNFIMNFILTISNFIFPLITFPYVSRVLGASGVGTVNFATSIISYFSMVGMMGIPTYGIRACAKVRDDKEKLEKTVQEIMALNMIVMAVSFIFLFVTVLSVPKLLAEKELYLILSSTLLFNVLGVDWLYKSLERYSYMTIRSILFKFISVLLLFLLVHSPEDYVIYGAISVFAAVGSNLLNFLGLNRLVSLKPKKDLNLLQHLKPTLTFFLLTVSTTIYVNVDTTMLGFVKGNEAVGYYSAAVKIKQILVSVVTSLGAVLLPRLSYHYEQGNHGEFERLTKKALNFVFLLSIPLVIYFIFVSRDAIVFLSGQDFLPAVLPMQFIMPTVLFIGLSNLMGMQILVPTNREKLVVYSTVCGALIDVVINLFLIPNLGAQGAAIAGSIAEFSVTAIQFLFIKEFMWPILKSIHFGKIGLALLAASLLLVLIQANLVLNTFLQLALTGSAFFGLYGLVLYGLKEEFVRETVDSLLQKINFRR
ncbi:flippase [Streptococcus suis]|uniref:Flippase n=1 Tax=Streptococcus suis TaxID=1307 RepID=A0A4T2GPT0_STRSU|nr:flippase [Streptococcus suis]MBM7268747.1 flippase [Streptococcus suis]MBM7269539.1 flippase [Streptococcus suis]TII00302.1 flippase [Streptococcus suis]TII00802.1 flippase [Streptococcus suis]